MDQSVFVAWLVAWLACMAFVMWRQSKDASGTGLLIAYALQLWVIHWLAAAIYAFPWYGPPQLPTALGLRESTYGAMGFAVGAGIVAPALFQRIAVPAGWNGSSAPRLA